MCQSKSQGGRRCASHNRAREAVHARREARAAADRRDELISGGATEVEIADARRDAARASAIAILVDPKLTSSELDLICTCPADRETADQAVQASREAARLSGAAVTERLFDRTDEAAALEAEADDERGRMGRAVDALLSNMSRTRYVLADRIADLGDTLDDDAKPTTKTTAKSETSAKGNERGLLRSWLLDVATQVDGAIAESLEDAAAGLGISTPTTVPTTNSTTTADDVPACTDDAATETEPAADADQCDEPAADANDQDGSEETSRDHAGVRDDDYEPDEADNPARQDADAHDQGDSHSRSTSRPSSTAPQALDTAAAPTTPAADPLTAGHHTPPAVTAATSAGGGTNAAPTSSTRTHTTTSTPRTHTAATMNPETAAEHVEHEEVPAFDPADLAQLSDAELLELIARLTQTPCTATQLRGQ